MKIATAPDRQRADLVEPARHPRAQFPPAGAGGNARVEGDHRQAVTIEMEDAVDRLCGNHERLA
jgi:hypothetical protein